MGDATCAGAPTGQRGRSDPAWPVVRRAGFPARSGHSHDGPFSAKIGAGCPSGPTGPSIGELDES